MNHAERERMFEDLFQRHSTAIILGACALGRRVRRKRFEKECRLLIDRLEAVLQTMEADRV